MNQTQKLTAFLYIIIRDHLPSGAVANAIMYLESMIEDDVEFSNEHLKALAEDYAKRILSN